MSTGPILTLDYAAPRRRYEGAPQDARKSRLGAASCMCWGASIACLGLCLLTGATTGGMSAFAAALMMTLVLIGWVASIVGTFIGMMGALPLRRRGEYALAGLILNGVTCLCPFTFCLIYGLPLC